MRTKSLKDTYTDQRILTATIKFIRDMKRFDKPFF